MVIQDIQTTNNSNNSQWWNPLRLFSGGGNLNLSSQFAQEGDANIGSGLINVTKKEVSMSEQNSTQFSDSRDMSTSSVYSPTDVSNYTLTNAPTLVFNSPNASVSGARPVVTTSPNVNPSVATKKENSVSQDAKQETDQSRGLDLEKIGLYVAVASVVIFILMGSKKIIAEMPQARAIAKLTPKRKSKKKK